MSRRTRSRNAFETTLNGAIGSGDTSIVLTSASGLTAPGWLCIDPDSPTLREYIKFTGISTNTLTGVTRGEAGSAGGAQAHANGVVVRMVPVHQTQDDIFQDIEDLEANEVTGGNAHDHSGGDGAQIDHAGLANLATGDPHTQYRLESADHDHSATGLEGGLVDHADLSNAGSATGHVTNGDTHDHAGGDGAQIDHGGLAGNNDDDHTQYLNTTRHDADNHSALVERLYVSQRSTAVEVTTSSVRWYAPFNLDIQRVTAMLKTASSSGSVEADVHRNGTTIFTTQSLRPIITASNFFDASGSPNGTTTMTKDTDYLEFLCDAAGTGAEGLVFCVEFVRT